MAKIVNGKADGLFSPYENVTREEFVKMLVGLVDVSGIEYDSDFIDADKDEWYYPYISKE